MIIRINGKKYRLNRTVWRRRGKGISAIMLMLSFLSVMGTVGSMELEMIPSGQAVVQLIVGFVLMGISALVLDVLECNK